uniref:Uncharacterized protein n=1 Tax=Cacopsylla melanoneura TaxID=428564 RepID=A0A8D8Z3B2_9HEMI
MKSFHRFRLDKSPIISKKSWEKKRNRKIKLIDNHQLDFLFFSFSHFFFQTSGDMLKVPKALKVSRLKYRKKTGNTFSTSFVMFEKETNYLFYALGSKKVSSILGFGGN